MPFVRVEDGRIFYESLGKGRPLVLLPGAWASQRWWKWQIPELSRRYRVVSMDMRGHGRSSDSTKGYPLKGYVADLDNLLQKLGIHETALVGWSMGGMIAMQYCLQHPQKVKALVLMATRGHRNPAMKPRILFQYLRSILRLLSDFTAPRNYDRSGASFRRESKRWIEKETRKALSSPGAKDVFEWMVSELTRHPRRNYLEVARGLWGWELGEALNKIPAPTLVMVGENDPWTPPRFSRLLQETIPNARLLIVEGQKHYMAMERPGLVNAAIIKFLSEQHYL